MNHHTATPRQMSAEQRRLWVRMVLGCPDLTAAQKTVLVALETYADYRTGTNAHPGEERLAVDCDLKPRAVRYALERAQGHNERCAPDCTTHLGLIERTHEANSRAGRAAVYRLTMPDELPITTGTAVPVNNASTGTQMPVIDLTTGTAMHDDRHGHDTFTGTAVPPTLQAPPILKHQPSVSESGTSPTSDPATHTDRAPSRFCDLHPQGTRKPCGGCANARTAFNAWQADRAASDVAIAAAEDRERRDRRRRIAACNECDLHGRIEVERGGERALAQCEHPNVPRIENAS